MPLFSGIVTRFNLRPNTFTCLVMMGIREKRRLSQHKGPLWIQPFPLSLWLKQGSLASKSWCTNVWLNNALSSIASSARIHAEYMRHERSNRDTHALRPAFTEHVTRSHGQKFNKGVSFCIVDQLHRHVWISARLLFENWSVIGWWCMFLMIAVICFCQAETEGRSSHLNRARNEMGFFLHLHNWSNLVSCQKGRWSIKHAALVFQ